MKSAYEIIKRPIITEKITAQQEESNKVAFSVDVHANKIEVKRAIEQIFNVKVEKVATMNIEGKMKRLGVHQGRRPNRKKAIVTLAKGESIDLLGGV
ncbi:MAG: 50S ribosomal protein L23 [bacterium]